MSDNNKSEQIRIYGKDITFNVKNFDSLEEFNQNERRLPMLWL